ncbi:MAG: tetratricopeptide repeat protein [Spirochaetia bacterium]
MKKKLLSLILLCLTIFSVWAASEETRLFEEAERRYNRGDYRFALSRYEKLIQEYPTSEYSADAHFRKGVILFRIGKPAEAVSYLDRVKNRYGYTRFAPYIPFWQGAAHYMLDEYESAMEYFSSFLDSGTQRYREDALFYKALCQRELNEPEKALETIETISEDPLNLFSKPEVFRLYVDVLLKMENYEQILSVYDSVPIDEAPKELSHPLTLYRAEALYALERREEAEKLYEQLLEAETDISAIAYQRLFSFYLEEGRDEESQVILERAQSALSGYPELLNEFFMRVGINSFKAGNHGLAESYLRRVRRSVSPEEIDELVPLYLTYAVEKNEGADEALSLLEEYITASEDRLGRSEALLFAAVRLSSENENWKKAEQYGERYLDMYPESDYSARANYLYAFALRERGKPGAALTVLSDMSRSREERDIYDDILLLTARAGMDLERWEEAEEALREYLSHHPEDPQGYMDLMRVSFYRNEWEQVQRWVDELYEHIPGFEEEYPDLFYQTIYFEGLASLGLGEYKKGAEKLEGIAQEEFFKSGSAEVLGPQLLFFAGWGWYKGAEYSNALSFFSRLRELYPEHERVQESLYLAGWSAFAAGSYREAEEMFAEYARFADERNERMRGHYMNARSLASQGDTQEALLVYRDVFEDGKGTPAADDALYEYAELLAEVGRIDDSTEAFLRLYREYPRSDLAEEALFRRGELLIREEEYEEAREAYYVHRSRFPRGELIDLSLYWGAVAARRSGEPYGAALLLERLTEEYSESSIHEDALQELAELYDEVGNYEKAVRYYRSFRSQYSEKAEEENITRRIETLKEIMDGKSSREAELTVTLEQSGLDTQEGREAAVELAGIYLNRYSEDIKEKREEALSLLRSVVERTEEEAEESSDGEGSEKNRHIAARAQYYIGEYHRRDGAHSEAAKTYADAAALAQGDEDLTARSMYMAAESAEKAGDTAGARKMVQRLETNFPDSEWSEEGRRLIDENS